MVTQILLIGMNGWLLFNVQIAVAVNKNIKKNKSVDIKFSAHDASSSGKLKTKIFESQGKLKGLNGISKK
jgi:hypothetical protein